jgi:phosphoribosylformylglycinamidine cyclo-ligase
MTGSAAYEAAGVNLKAGNAASDQLFQTGRRTWNNRAGEFGEPEQMTEGFSGIRGVDMDRLFEFKEQYPDAQFIQFHVSDGTGNKPKVAQRVGRHNTIGHDLVAMLAEDVAASGAEGMALTSVLVVNTLGKKDDHPNKKARIGRYVAELAEGYEEGANEANLVIENGETAEHGEGVDGYGEFRYDWSGTLSWIALKERLLDGRKVKAGNAVVALKEDGFRCNGFSLVLKTLEQAHGYEWHHEPFGENSTWGEEVLRPSRIYTGMLTALTGGYRPDIEPKAEVGAIAHITGGGIPEKLGRRLLKLGLGARLDNLFAPAPAMLELQRLTGVDDEEIYNVLNMGQGILVVTSEPDKVLAEAEQRGISAQLAGEITAEEGIHAKSQGALQNGQWLTF